MERDDHSSRPSQDGHCSRPSLTLIDAPAALKSHVRLKPKEASHILGPHEMNNDISNRKFQSMPLHRLSAKAVCDCVEEWVVNDMNHKKHLAKTKETFINKNLSGERMIGLERTDQIKHLVKHDLSPSFISEETFDIMFSCYDQWKNKVLKSYQSYKEITSKTAQEMAHILFHCPLNCLLIRIHNEDIDGSKLIASLAKEQHDKNAFHIIAAETGWHDDEVRQILSVLFRHHTWTQSEFANNFDRIWNKQEYNAVSRHISKIEAVVLGHNVDEIHYKIKHAQPIDEFSDCIINMVDEMIGDTQNDDVIKCIYEGIAECFIFDRKSEDLILELQHWMCNNCGNCNINMMIDSKHTKRIPNCILCGLSQRKQIILKLKNHDTYLMVNNGNSVDVEDDSKAELDDIDVMIEDILTQAFDLHCPGQNDNRNCVAIMRLTKILIKYKRWLYTIYKKSKGNDDIKRTIQVDIAKFVSDEEYAIIFKQSMEA
eukprot:261608_1